MTRMLGAYRLIPIVLLATGALFLLKSAGLFLEGGYTLGERMATRGTPTMTVTIPASPATSMATPSVSLNMASNERRPSWMQEMFNYPDSNHASRQTSDAIVTGSVGDKPKAPAAAGAPETRPAGDTKAAQADAKPPQVDPKAPPANLPPAPQARTVSIEPQRNISASERALLERLQQRRQELEARGRELDIRENMVKAAEKKLEAKLAEIKAAEQRVAAGLKQRDDEDAKRFKGIVTMYETMKPREAAKIFDRLEPRVLLEVASQLNPRRMSDIMAQMNPEAAEKLTVELASRATAQDRARDPSNLPKIEGRPTGG
jgi:flagellar motility protein MotE (MotC chaperone)